MSLQSFSTRISACILACAFFTVTADALAQKQVSSLGNDYWIGFMPNYIFPAVEIDLFIASPVNNTVRVDYYGGGSGGVANTINVNMDSNTARTIIAPVGAVETWDLEKP